MNLFLYFIIEKNKRASREEMEVVKLSLIKKSSTIYAENFIRKFI